ncbi:YbaB/EbfC family nucleoid-associated protein [Actinoallomurus purpureus]|uniref:YbaB/EbfC family nucleoid-associated protein n=1 Tax=Actinoallomurus purpureus TaxID=478114 RepID=UPI002093F986|nr:YbaB/EbfC family nucleoid-associated protein [Actinoallomurus purpureus]MCO6006944.1 YbaB/EbfC family nucleoid-associated protein [Actinoallomurus purpureus]
MPIDLEQLAQELPKIKERASAIAAEVVQSSFEGSSADERVVATVTGAGVLTAVRITELARRQVDNLTLGDLVVEAVRAAEAAARQEMRDRLAEVTIGGESLGKYVPDPRTG